MPPDPLSLFQVEPQCLALGLRAGAILFHDIQIRPASESLRTTIENSVARVRCQFPEMRHAKQTAELSKIDEVFRACGVKPRKHSSSVHRLYHGAIKRHGFPAINNLVDAYNLISLQSRCTLGAHDVRKFTPPCTLRLTRGDESFLPLDQEVEQTIAAGEFAYVDAENRLMCRLNVLQADFSKVTAATTNAMVIIEGSTAHEPTTLKDTFDRCLELVENSCGGRGEVISFPTP